MSVLAPPVSGLERLSGPHHRRTTGVRATAWTRASRAWRSPSTAFSTTPVGEKRNRRREGTTGFEAFLAPNDAAFQTRSRAIRNRVVLPRAFPPKRDLDDIELVKGDAFVLWLFALAQKAAAESFAPSFPGWLAPAKLDALSFASFLVETSILIAAWVGASAAVGAYELRVGGEDSEEGEMLNAVNGAFLGWVAFCAPAFFFVRRARDSLFFLSESGASVDAAYDVGIGRVVPNGFPVPLTLALVLLVMLSWRAYVKVIGLLGWWRAERERGDSEDDAWEYLLKAQMFAAGLALSAAVADFAARVGSESSL